MSNCFATAFIRNSGAVPIARRRDHKNDKSCNNDDAFAAMYDALYEGDYVAIAPEGGSRFHPAMQNLKTGTARIAFEAVKRGAKGTTVRILPIGINYLHRER